MNFAEKFIAGEFAVLVVLWCTRTVGDYPGWSAFFGGLPNEGTVSVSFAPHFSHALQTTTPKSYHD
jgi:hypothetical protein